jgi:outer membrane immunogenic protein
MKRFTALTVVLTAVFGLTQIAFAGSERYDAKESKAVVQPAPECDWTGFYIGGNIGWRGGENLWWDKSDSGSEGNGGWGEIVDRHSQSDIIGGLQLGYNRQINSWFVIGFELTGSYSGGLDDTKSYLIADEQNELKHFKTQSDWSGTFALRLGVTAMNNKLLVYGKAGGAVTHWNYEYVNDESTSAGRPEFDRYKKEETRISPMVGAGLEYSINCHWSAKLEWNHIFLGRESNNGTLVEDFEENDVFNVDHQLAWDSVTAGINYKF